MSRIWGITLTIALLLVPWLMPQSYQRLSFAALDLYQRWMPRERVNYPVQLVAIDAASLAQQGQWPWPRNKLSELIATIGKHNPAAIGIDVIFPEPDRSSPEQLADRLAISDDLRSALKTLPTNDSTLARVLAQTPSVIGVGFGAEGMANIGRGPTPIRQQGDVLSYARSYNDALHNIPEIEQAAQGLGALVGEPDFGVIRRIPALVKENDQLWPSLSLEMLRIATGSHALIATADAAGITKLKLAEVEIPTDVEGRWWLHFAPSTEQRIISASDVFAGRFSADQFTHKLVILGFAAQGTVDIINSPLGDRRAGYEVHAEAIENVIDARLLQRPRWAAVIEALCFLTLALLSIWAAPRAKPRLLLVIAALITAGVMTTGLFAFANQGWLLDVFLPLTGAGLVLATMVALTLIETERRRQHLAAELAQQREASARIDGELQAARRIQLGLLPDPKSLRDERIDIATLLVTARSVGGDLFDFFLLNENELFVLIGDVSGKGVPASLFMALAKSLTKSNVLRPGQELAATIHRAQQEIAWDNAESMFVTLVACVINLKTGDLRYVNAGHETPLIIHQGTSTSLASNAPPLCVLDDFEFFCEQAHLPTAAFLVLVTDGVTEAMNERRELYGRARLQAVVAQPHANSNALVRALEADVRAFANGTELPDDLAIVVLRRN